MDDTYIIAVYIFCDDVLIGLGHEDDSQSKMTNAEVLTFAIIASKFFNSNHKDRQRLLHKSFVNDSRL